MTDEIWEVIERRELLDRRPWLRLWEEDVRLPNGQVITGFTALEMPDVAVIVALTDAGRVVIERSYKHGPRRDCLTLPAGYLEPGEEPLAAAQRELREETGYEAASWHALGSFVTDGNRGGGANHLFLARGATQVVTPNAGDLEEITVTTLPLAEVVAATHTGDVAILAVAAAIGLAVAALA